MLINLPKNSKVYIFGSALYSDKPNDLDVLIVYDPGCVHPKDVYNVYDNFLMSLSKRHNLKTDVTFLTINENLSDGFVDRVKAMEYEIAIPKLTKPSTEQQSCR